MGLKPITFSFLQFSYNSILYRQPTIRFFACVPPGRKNVKRTEPKNHTEAMRNLLVLIVLGAAGYYGWQAYQKDPQFFAKYLPKQQTEESAESSSSGASDSAPDNASASAAAAPAATPPPPPVFTSRIAVPAAAEGEKRTLAPGQFLVITRASVETKDGVTAIVPGDLVKLVERRSNGTMQVTNGKYDFVVKESQVTQDVAVAQEAERREFQKRYGTLR